MMTRLASTDHRAMWEGLFGERSRGDEEWGFRSGLTSRGVPAGGEEAAQRGEGRTEAGGEAEEGGLVEEALEVGGALCGGWTGGGDRAAPVDRHEHHRRHPVAPDAEGVEGVSE